MTTPWMLSCGELLYDVTTDDAERLHAHVGGGPANAALAIARAGGRAALWTGVPAGVYGDRLRAALADGGVALDHARTSALAPTLAIATPRGTSVHYHLYAEGTSAFDVAPGDAPVIAPDGRPFGLVHLGALGTAVDPMASALRAASIAWREAGTVIGYDPNMRDGFADRGQSIDEVEWWFGRADIVKVSTEDLTALYGDLDRQACAERILQLGARLVLVTDGPGPVLAYSPAANATREVTPWPDDVLPVGAGDAFIAGVYAHTLAHPSVLDGAAQDALGAVLEAGLASVATRFAGPGDQP